MDYEEEVRKHYIEHLDSTEDSSAAVRWSRKSQLIRFDVVKEHIKEDDILLDYGCGLAHLYPFLKSHSVNVEYTGIDILRGMIDKCKIKYQKPYFIVGEVDDVTRHYDICVAVGPFNTLIRDEMTTVSKTIMTIQKLTQKCNKVVVLLASDKVDKEHKDSTIYYYNAHAMMCHFSKFQNVKNCYIEEGYLQHDFALVIEMHSKQTEEVIENARRK